MGQLTPSQFEAPIQEPDDAIDQTGFACTAWSEVAKNASLRESRAAGRTIKWLWRVQMRAGAVAARSSAMGRPGSWLPDQAAADGGITQPRSSAGCLDCV
jgi:hypothetical protein